MSTAEISEIRHPWDVVGELATAPTQMVDGANRSWPLPTGRRRPGRGVCHPRRTWRPRDPGPPHSEVVVSLLVVAGALANKPWNGGEAWVRMTWVRGLQRLGCRVGFVEQIAEGNCVDASGRPVALGASQNRQWFEMVTSEFGLGGVPSLLSVGVA